LALVEVEGEMHCIVFGLCQTVGRFSISVWDNHAIFRAVAAAAAVAAYIAILYSLLAVALASFLPGLTLDVVRLVFCPSNVFLITLTICDWWLKYYFFLPNITNKFGDSVAAIEIMGVE